MDIVTNIIDKFLDKLDEEEQVPTAVRKELRRLSKDGRLGNQDGLEFAVRLEDNDHDED